MYFKDKVNKLLGVWNKELITEVGGEAMLQSLARQDETRAELEQRLEKLESVHDSLKRALQRTHHRPDPDRGADPIRDLWTVGGDLAPLSSEKQTMKQNPNDVFHVLKRAVAAACATLVWVQPTAAARPADIDLAGNSIKTLTLKPTSEPAESEQGCTPDRQLCIELVAQTKKLRPFSRSGPPLVRCWRTAGIA